MGIPQNRYAVVTGVGVVSPVGIGKVAFWNALLDGKSGIREVKGPLSRIPSHGFGGTLEDFDPKAHVRPRKALKVMCREIQTAFAAATMAISDAGLSGSSIPAERIGTVFGSEMMSGEPEELIDTMLDCGVTSGSPRERDFGESAMRKIFPLWMLKYLPNMATCHVGISLGALGPNNTVLMGDTSGLAALEESVSVIQRGMADAMITGAAGTRLSPTRTIFTGGMQAAPRRSPLSSSSRPMLKDRRGVVSGEGAAVLAIESIDNALDRGINPKATIAGVASRYVTASANGDDQAPAPKDAIRLSVRAALKAAGISASDIGVVISQAMGHPSVDLSEAQVIAEVFGEQTPVYAPIAAFGHTGAAVGALALSAAVAILEHAVIPATLHADERDNDCRVNLLVNSQLLARPYACVLSHTFSGGAVTAILKRYDER